MIASKDIQHIARLARIKFSGEEENEMCSHLHKILDYINKLNELNTSNVNPTVHAIEMPIILRNDVIKPSLELEKVLENAPAQDKNFFTVPKVIDKE